jgi:2-hydroxy-6-oxonona-2,4-dienedioate hydrolase
VILLHGLGGVKEMWMDNFAAFSTGHHVYALDQLGFGHSDKPLLEYKIATWVDFLEGFMQAENIRTATLVGNSLGGWFALEFTAQHPDRVEKLVLVDAAGLAWGAGGPVVDLNPSSLAGWRTLLESLFYDKKMVSDQLVERVFTDHMRNNDGYTIERTVAGFAQPQFEDDKLKSIRAPTLVVWGREDKLISVARAEKFREGIPGANWPSLSNADICPSSRNPTSSTARCLIFSPTELLRSPNGSWESILRLTPPFPPSTLKSDEKASSRHFVWRAQRGARSFATLGCFRI